MAFFLPQKIIVVDARPFQEQSVINHELSLEEIITDHKSK